MSKNEYEEVQYLNIIKSMAFSGVIHELTIGYLHALLVS